MATHTREVRTYIQVGANGDFRKSVPEGTEGAVRREYEDRETKEIKVKHEIIYSIIDGMLGSVTIRDGQYGEQVMVPVTDPATGEELTISLGLTSNFGEDFLKRLPNIDLSQPVVLAPYSFTNDKGKPVKGINIYQGNFEIANGMVKKGTGVKIGNFYRDEEAKKNANGFPEPEGDTNKYKPDDWKVYFITARKFLVNDLKERGLIKEAVAASPDF